MIFAVFEVCLGCHILDVVTFITHIASSHLTPVRLGCDQSLRMQLGRAVHVNTPR